MDHCREKHAIRIHVCFHYWYAAADGRLWYTSVVGSIAVPTGGGARDQDGGSQAREGTRNSWEGDAGIHAEAELAVHG